MKFLMGQGRPLKLTAAPKQEAWRKPNDGKSVADLARAQWSVARSNFPYHGDGVTAYRRIANMASGAYFRPPLSPNDPRSV